MLLPLMSSQEQPELALRVTSFRRRLYQPAQASWRGRRRRCTLRQGALSSSTPSGQCWRVCRRLPFAARLRLLPLKRLSHLQILDHGREPRTVRSSGPYSVAEAECPLRGPFSLTVGHHPFRLLKPYRNGGVALLVCLL